MHFFPVSYMKKKTFQVASRNATGKISNIFSLTSRYLLTKDTENVSILLRPIFQCQMVIYFKKFHNQVRLGNHRVKCNWVYVFIIGCSIFKILTVFKTSKEKYRTQHSQWICDLKKKSHFCRISHRRHIWKLNFRFKKMKEKMSK